MTNIAGGVRVEETDKGNVSLSDPHTGVVLILPISIEEGLHLALVIEAAHRRGQEGEQPGVQTLEGNARATRDQSLHMKRVKFQRQYPKYTPPPGWVDISR